MLLALLMMLSSEQPQLIDIPTRTCWLILAKDGTLELRYYTMGGSRYRFHHNSDNHVTYCGSKMNNDMMTSRYLCEEDKYNFKIQMRTINYKKSGNFRVTKEWFTYQIDKKKVRLIDYKKIKGKWTYD